MLNHLRELASARELLYIWTLRDFKVRYSQSLLGAAWAILQPLSLMIVFSLIFALFIHVPTDGVPYPAFAYSALLVWTFFANSLTMAMPSLINNINLVSKIYFPREILPIAANLVSMVDFAIAAVIFAPLMIVYKIAVGWTIIFLPLLLTIQVLFTVGISLAAAAINVFYRDVRFIIPLALQIWMYLSPVIYPTSLVPERLQFFYFLNPMATLIESYRRIIFFNQPPDWFYLSITIAITTVVVLISYWYFKRVECLFADLI
ncbi:MAG: ABC transporter permease [Oscillochloridaceae bacterium]|nr:ABC transporter permease [Chloroflexaceae bacterium]MDW8389817.1 ABC transporter permease [Oscillochloridaceae bacterium]